jgi:hypothetical protein
VRILGGWISLGGCGFVIIVAGGLGVFGYHVSSLVGWIGSRFCLFVVIVVIVTGGLGVFGCRVRLLAGRIGWGFCLFVVIVVIVTGGLGVFGCRVRLLVIRRRRRSNRWATLEDLAMLEEDQLTKEASRLMRS